MNAALLLAAFAMQGATADENAALAFMQSRMVPASFETCAQFHPRAAADYDTAMAAWMRRHQAQIARGEGVARARLQQDGEKLDEVLVAQRAHLQDEIRGLPADERTRMCDRLLETMREE